MAHARTCLPQAQGAAKRGRAGQCCTSAVHMGESWLPHQVGATCATAPTTRAFAWAAPPQPLLPSPLVALLSSAAQMRHVGCMR